MRTKIAKLSHAKVILIGEHSVVYGQPAIALPLPSLKMKVEIQPDDRGTLIQNMNFSGPVNKMPNYMLGTRRLIQTVLKRFGEDHSGLAIKVTKNFPAGRGMGSSAAVAIAMTKALYAYFGHPLSRIELMKVSNIEEKITHGNPSGIDTATTSSSRPVWFVSGRPIQNFSLNLRGSLVIADSGSAGNTGVAVNAVKQKLVKQSTVFRPKIKKLGQLAKAAKNAIAAGKVAKLGKEMNQSQRQLSELGVSNHKLDTLIQAARANGAEGAKLTGSGLGGCIIALAKDNSSATQVSRALLNAGATKTWQQPFKS